jgi:hypothetical protein
MAEEFKINRTFILIVVFCFLVIQCGYWFDYKWNPEHYIFSSEADKDKDLKVVITGNNLLTQKTWIVSGFEMEKALKYNIMQRPIRKTVPVLIKDDFHKYLDVYNQVVMLLIGVNIVFTIKQLNAEKKAKQIPQIEV